MISNRHPDLNFMDNCTNHYQNKAYSSREKLKQFGTGLQILSNWDVAQANKNVRKSILPKAPIKDLSTGEMVDDS